MINFIRKPLSSSASSSSPSSKILTGLFTLQLLSSLSLLSFFDSVDVTNIIFSFELQVIECRKGLDWTTLNSLGEIPSFSCIKLVLNKGVITGFEEKCDKGYTSLWSISQVFVPGLVKLVSYSCRADAGPYVCPFFIAFRLKRSLWLGLENKQNFS